MPEGDTIFRAARTLHQALGGKRVARFESVLPQLMRIDVDAPIEGRTVEAVTSAGKHQLMRFSGDLVLRTHMRMNGSWHIYRPGEVWRKPRSAMRILVATEDYVAVAFNVPVAEFLTAAQAERQMDLRKMGPDLLGETFDEEEARRRILARPGEQLGEVLLNQRVIAGAGNVFKSEILFVAGVHPFRLVSSLTDAELDAILRASRKFLVANVASKKGDGIVTYFGFRRTTGRSDPSQRLYVYSRGGQPCRRCASAVAFDRQGLHARVTYWCPSCQPETQPADASPIDR